MDTTATTRVVARRNLCGAPHVAPESSVGGPLALVQSSDEIELDVNGRGLHLLVDDAEIERRRVTARRIWHLLAD